MTRNERLRFNISDDILLLKEVISINPYENNNNWKIIQSHVNKATGKDFTLRSVRDHVEYLLKLYIKDDRINLRRSGTEEQYNEKEKLVQDVLDLMRKYKESTARFFKFNRDLQKRDKERKARASAMLELAETIDREMDTSIVEWYDTAAVNIVTAEQISEIPDTEGTSKYEESQEEFTETVSESHHSTQNQTNVINDKKISRFKRKQSVLKNACLEYLKESHTLKIDMKRKQQELEERRLQLEEDKLKFEKEKFAFEKLERETRLQLEMEERKYNMEILKQQQNIIKFFINRTDS